MPTKIRGGSFIFAHQVEAADASFETYFKWLLSMNDKRPWPYHRDNNGTIQRRLYAFFSKDSWYGMILSAKTDVFRHLLKRENGDITIEAIAVGDTPDQEINFFCIRKDSSKGIFSHYNGSYPFGSFVQDLWGTYREFVKQKKYGALHSCSKNKINDISKTYSLRGKAGYGPLYSQEEFKKLLKKLSAVKQVRLTRHADFGEDDAPKIGQFFKTKTEIFNINYKKQISNQFIDWILESRSKCMKRTTKGFRYTGSVDGLDESNNPFPINFEDTMQNFLDFNRDDLGSIRLSELNKHEIMRSMRQRLKNEILFEPSA